MDAWESPLTDALPSPAPGNFSIRASLTRTVTAENLQADLTGYALIDARSEARFAGREEPIDPVAGHIPGAICLPFQGNLADDGRFSAPETLARRFAAANPGQNTVCYCGSGVTAAHNILALKIAGYPEPMLYPGSWSEWLRSRERPIATSPGA